uniref:Mitochondrial fission 1 protein n=2 Tax=Hirondellea gigas TaxID=1518452 RepID=A0A2P2HXP0_9CRUS
MASSPDMDDFLGWHASSEDIQRHEKAYNEEVLSGKVTSATKFNYSCFLIQSRYPGDVKRGISLLEELYQSPEESGKRDYVYFLAVGNARLHEYRLALQYLNGLLAVEPKNKQVLELKASVDKRMRGEAIKGAAVAGGVLVGLGAIVGLGIALAKR